ncbi:hypothetical protein CTEN210_14600 [Chaetoceros tenuissimus]|uniref:Uncharacterized protein n=1 Tax=Chaetoceros tenuissimus TaxID=426638 RepID=A0AAD3D8U0_9STRA|nr:hypothetical protein CTEN210_14600 [Chaetoceros tenuissimus]
MIKYYSSSGYAREVEEAATVTNGMKYSTFSVQLVSASLSFLSSIAILYIIRKSSKQLSSSYHRIMTFMSIFDIIASISIGIGTIPFPTDSIYPFQPPMLGTDASCKTQAFLIMFGIVGAATLYLSLSWYFVARIIFRQSDFKIKYRLEPCFYSVTLAIALFIPSYFLQKNELNVSPYEPFCIITVKTPDSCSDESDWVDCYWREWTDSNHQQSLNVVLYWFACTFVLVLIAMVMIINFICRRKGSSKCSFINCCTDFNEEEPTVDATVANSSNPAQDQPEEVNERMGNVVAIQAIMYIFAFFLTWLFVIISVIVGEGGVFVDYAKIFFMPLQGFWNMLIFIFDKYVQVKTQFQQEENNGETQGFWKTIQVIFTKPENLPPIYFSDLPPNSNPRIFEDDDISSGVETREQTSENLKLYADISQKSNDDLSYDWSNAVSSVGVSMRSFSRPNATNANESDNTITQTTASS